MNHNKIIETVIETINDVKSTGFCTESVDLEFYLGGDLGIDSIEMLEIWYDLEKKLNIKIEDSEKRDLYTLGDAVNVLEQKIEQKIRTKGAA